MKARIVTKEPKFNVKIVIRMFIIKVQIKNMSANNFEGQNRWSKILSLMFPFS